ncbi:MAG: peptidase M28, partial [Sphingomonadales bacterium]|nr:peptidase M28 [Sphingomonadales bacterium]
MKPTALLLATAILALPTSLFAAPEDSVSVDRLRADIDTLVGFGTRHTLSVQDDPKRGIGAARRWAEGEFRKISAGCGDCLEIATPEAMVQGARIPDAVRL